MLNEFWFNVLQGMYYVLDSKAYHHALFLIVFTVPYVFKEWKRVFSITSVFMLGYTLSLLLASYKIVTVSYGLVKLLIPITILVVVLYNIFTAGKKTAGEKTGILFFSAVCFGFIHGLSFAKEFLRYADSAKNRLLSLLEFTLGIITAQIIIVFAVLVLAFIGQTIFRFSRRDWIMVISATALGLIIPKLIENNIFS